MNADYSITQNLLQQVADQLACEKLQCMADYATIGTLQHVDLRAQAKLYRAQAVYRICEARPQPPKLTGRIWSGPQQLALHTLFAPQFTANAPYDQLLSNYKLADTVMDEIVALTRWSPIIDLCCSLDGLNALAPLFYDVSTDAL